MATTATAEAARAFQEELDRLSAEAPIELDEASAVGRRGALYVAARGLWERQSDGLLDPDQVRDLLGVRSRNGVHDLVRRGRLLRVDDRGGRPLYPSVQFDRNGRPFDVLPRVLEAFAAGHASPWTVASFLASPQRLLNRQTPRAWLLGGRDPNRVVEAARRVAARLAR